MVAAPKPIPVRVIGLGNEYRGDDAIGIAVARAVGHQTRAAGIVASIGDGTDLLETWQDVPLCFLIDCTVSGNAAGTVLLFDALHEEMPESLFSTFSTHAFSVQQALALGRALDRLPGRLYVYGIEGQNFECGAPISTVVQQAGDRVVRAVLNHIYRYQASLSHACNG